MLSLEPGASAIPVTTLSSPTLAAWCEAQDSRVNAWIDAHGFKASAGSACVIPDGNGHPERVLVGMQEGQWLWALAPLVRALPGRDYYLDVDVDGASAHLATLGFALATYRYTRYGKSAHAHGALAVPPGVDQDAVRHDFAAIALARDLINTPAQDLMPEDLHAAATQVADEYGASINAIVGDDLLEAGYPAVHAVGRASAHAPRLVDLQWGSPDHPKVTLVGKGVCFDSGGLDIKPASGMRLMKKDMGGAAHALALAQRIMAAQLPVRLRLLIPTVENAISGSAFHPGDVLATRAGKTVEVDNTDAEGRLILCDALTEASREKPQQIIDFATLTGAARVALGTEVPAMFCNNDMLSGQLEAASEKAQDPLWRMPLHQPYRAMLDSQIADMVNSASAPFGGAITAALFLESFVENDVPWAHFDLMAWNNKSRPGRPEGGEAMALRACFAQIQDRFDR